jgi:hypothetical protein
MKKHKFKRKPTKKKANPQQLKNRYKFSGSPSEALGVAAAFLSAIVAVCTSEEIQSEENIITVDAEFTIEDPKQLPPCQ